MCVNKQGVSVVDVLINKGLRRLGETLVVVRMMTYNLLSWSSVFHGDSLSQALAVQYQSSVWHTHV